MYKKKKRNNRQQSRQGFGNEAMEGSVFCRFLQNFPRNVLLAGQDLHSARVGACARGIFFHSAGGEHPDLVASFLNALLPFDKPEEEIETLQHLAPFHGR